MPHSPRSLAVLSLALIAFMFGAWGVVQIDECLATGERFAVCSGWAAE